MGITLFCVVLHLNIEGLTQNNFHCNIDYLEVKMKASIFETILEHDEKLVRLYCKKE